MSVLSALKNRKSIIRKQKKAKKSQFNKKFQSNKKYRLTKIKEYQFFIKKMSLFPIYNIFCKTTVYILWNRLQTLDEWEPDSRGYRTSSKYMPKDASIRASERKKED